MTVDRRSRHGSGGWIERARERTRALLWLVRHVTLTGTVIHRLQRDPTYIRAVRRQQRGQYSRPSRRKRKRSRSLRVSLPAARHGLLEICENLETRAGRCSAARFACCSAHLSNNLNFNHLD